MAIDLTPLYSHLNTGLELAGAAVVGWALLKAKQWADAHIAWLDSDTKAKLLNQLDAALNAGVAWGIAELEAAEKSHPALATPAGVKGFVIDKAGQYVVDHAESQLASVGWTPEDVAAKLAAKLPPVWVLADRAGTGALPPLKPVEIKPLPPIEGPVVS